MEKLNETYERPECNLRVIRFAQSLLLVSTNGNTINNATYDVNELGEWDEDEL